MSDTVPARAVHMPSHASKVDTAGRRLIPVALLVRDRVLGQRLLLHVRVRYVVAAALALWVWLAERLIGFEGLDVPALLLVARAVALYNLRLQALAPPRPPP